TNFVALAATLLLIKSKSLLPVFELTPEEEDVIEDLEERLKLYQIYRDAARGIEALFGTTVLHERQYVSDTKPLFVPDVFCDPTELREAMSRVLEALPKSEEKPKVRVKKVISLEEMMERLQTRIENQMRMRFSDLIGLEQERTTVIVGFLAVLESVKQGSIMVAQLQRFADIEIERENFKTPRYH
ncbi:segregation/condensation protein A, partial [Candidatus Kaiserbacteria bacterium]|nr:segregation/condensation protein A [Candidatus Kaiserbacteria bacterium]